MKIDIKFGSRKIRQRQNGYIQEAVSDYLKQHTVATGKEIRDLEQLAGTAAFHALRLLGAELSERGVTVSLIEDAHEWSCPYGYLGTEEEVRKHYAEKYGVTLKTD